MSKIKIVITILYHAVTILGIPDYCPKPISRAKEPSEHCAEASDPNELPKSGIEKWFTKEMFEVTIVIISSKFSNFSNRDVQQIGRGKSSTFVYQRIK